MEGKAWEWGQIKCTLVASFPAPLLRNVKLKLCMRREPGTFSDTRTLKWGRNCTWAYPNTQNREKSKDSGPTYYMNLAIGGWVSFIPRVKCKAGWITCKRLPFCSKNTGPISIMPWSREKRYQALHVCTFRVPGSLGTRLVHCNCQPYIAYT